MSLWMAVNQWALHILYSSKCECSDWSLTGCLALMACTLLSAINLQTPPRFAPVSHHRAVKNEVSVMKKRMRFICLPLLLFFYTPRRTHDREMRSGTPPRHAPKCNDATGSVWDADEPEESDITVNVVLVSKICIQKQKHKNRAGIIKVRSTWER